MGFHPLDWVIILAIGLLILGPKTIQSLSRSVGKTVGQAKEAKDKVLSELPVEELNSVRANISRLPLSPQQAVTMLLTPEQPKKEQEAQEKPEKQEEQREQGSQNANTL